MKRIPPHALWLGHAGDGRNLRQLFDSDIRARVELAADEAPLTAPRDRIVFRIPLIDGGGNDPATLSLAIHAIAGLLRAQIPTLVCCGAGMSRSPAVAAGALAVVTGEPLGDCLRLVAMHHAADVSPAFWHDLESAEQELRME